MVGWFWLLGGNRVIVVDMNVGGLGSGILVFLMLDRRLETPQSGLTYIGWGLQKTVVCWELIRSRECRYRGRITASVERCTLTHTSMGSWKVGRSRINHKIFGFFVPTSLP